MQSYASVVEANDYHNARQSANRWDDFSDEDKQRRLTSASDLIDCSFDFLGLPENNLHAFPRFLPIERRDGLFEREQKLSKTPILPEAVKRACCELALLDDISGSLPNAAKLRMIGAVVLKNSDCNGEDNAKQISLQAAVRLLQPYINTSKNGRLARG